MTSTTSFTRRRTSTLRAAGAPACLALLPFASACDLFTGTDVDATPVVYHAGTIEVFEESHDWSPLPLTYLRASLGGVNVTVDSVAISMPDCILDLEAFSGADAGPADEPSWSLRSRLSWPGSIGSVCIRENGGVLGPGDTLHLSTGAIPLAEILGDSLPVGSYRFRVRLDGRVTRGGSVRVESRLVDLGTITLPASHHPLSLETYPRDGFTYRVEIEPGSGPDEDGSVRLTVTHTAPFSGALTRELSLRCPVRLLGFETAADRDRIPVPPPLAFWPGSIRSCGEGTMPVRLEPGGAVTFAFVVPPTRFFRNGMRLSDYFIMAVIDVDGRPIRLALDPA